MSQTVVVDGEIALKTKIDGEVSLNSMIDGQIDAIIPADSTAFESGTIEVETATNRVTVDFALRHTSAPFFFALIDTTGTANPDTQALVMVSWFYPYILYDADMIRPGSRAPYKGIMSRIQQPNTTNDLTTLLVPLTTTNVVSNTGISEYVNYYLCPGRTYKWVAIWKA